MLFLEYLDNDSRAVPAIVVPKAIPFCLQNSVNIIPLAELNPIKNTPYMQLNVSKFTSYVRKNPEWICSMIKLFSSSSIYETNTSESSLVLAFKLAAYLFSSFFRLSNSEIETNVLLEQLLDLITDFENVMEYYSNDADVLFATRKLFKNFAFENNDILVADVNDIDGAVYEALTRDSAIIYDEKFYFVPEKLFKMACEPLASTISFLNIKRALHEENILARNENEASGFTIKKIIVSSYGIITRIRFLKIRKEFFFSVNEPNIEEKGGVFHVCRNV